MVKMTVTIVTMMMVSKKRKSRQKLKIQIMNSCTFHTNVSVEKAIAASRAITKLFLTSDHINDNFKSDFEVNYST